MDADPLEWWKNEVNCLPVLSVLAKKTYAYVGPAYLLNDF